MLIYATRITNRLGYTLNVVLRHILQLDFTITTDATIFANSEEPKFSYGTAPVGDAPHIHSCGLLFSTTIEEQNIKPTKLDDLPIIFPSYAKNALLPFDLFAATFYLVTRYEEYLPHHVDPHGRFIASESLAFRQHFLHIPIVDRWALMLYDRLKEAYPSLPPTRRRFEFVATIDIDAAYCYKHKGIFRTLMGLTKDTLIEPNKEATIERLKVLAGKERDPFDTFDYIIGLKKKYHKEKLLIFPLVSDYGQYDKPISYANKHFRDLVQHLGDYAKMGVHTSYNASQSPDTIKKETQRLSEILHRPIIRNRFHFLRLRLPQSYRFLTQEGILHDYTMGYADEPGFRSGTSTPYPFYDLEHDEESTLLIHPFCVMDTTLMKYKGLSPEQALEEYKKLIDETKAVNGTFCAIWHNQNICDTPAFIGWRKIYEEATIYALDQIKPS